jgi:hypothetical protein
MVNRGRVIAFGLAVCFGLLLWGALQTWGGTNGVRHAPVQAPARQEPGERVRPTLEPEPMAQLSQLATLTQRV